MRGAGGVLCGQHWCSSAHGTHACAGADADGVGRFASRGPPRRPSRVNGTRPRGAGLFPEPDYSTGPAWEQARWLAAFGAAASSRLGPLWHGPVGRHGLLVAITSGIVFPTVGVLVTGGLLIPLAQGKLSNRSRCDVGPSRDGDTSSRASFRRGWDCILMSGWMLCLRAKFFLPTGEACAILRAVGLKLMDEGVRGPG